MEFINGLIEGIQQIQVETIVNMLMAIIIFILFSLFSSSLSYLLIKLCNMKKNKTKIKNNVFYRPIRILFIVFGLYLGTLILKLPTDIMQIIQKALKITIICLIANAFGNMVNAKSEFGTKLQLKLGLNGDNTVANFIGKMLKAIIYIIAGFLVVSELGYDLSGIVTGLGLGGVVVAFAAQDIAKNLFGGLTIILDKPFNVGDWIEIGTYAGTVEDISFRSTKVRTVEDTIVTIPNSTISNETITNWNRISKRRYAFDLGFDLTTKMEKVKEIADKISFILKNNPNLEKETVEVHIDKITEYTINVFVSVYTEVTAYYDYLAVRETVNFSIMELLEKEEVALAYPTQSIELKK